MELENDGTNTNAIDPITKARSFVYQWAKESAPDPDFSLSDVKVVWFCKTLQNWKAILTIVHTLDDMIYEVSYNGDNKESYLDAYSKIKNVRIPD